MVVKDLAYRVDWFENSEIRRYLGPSVRNGTTLEKQKKWFQKLQKDNKCKFFVIKVDKKPIGNVSLGEISKIDKNASIFIVIGDKDYWGKGVAPDALKYITDYGFNELKLHKIYLYVIPSNVRAVRCYEKFGFIKEAVHTEMSKIDGKFHDEIFMSLTNPKEE